MRRVLITFLPFTCVLVLLPALVSAAGFAKESLFLSKTPVTEGETVLIHAVVANDATKTFSGDVMFMDAEIKIGSVAVSIAPGGANAVSISWKPVGGSHIVTAQLTNKDGTIAEQESATFTISSKPTPASAATPASTEVGSSASVQQTISNLSPTVANASKPLFAVLDSGRTSAVHYFDQGIDWAKKQVGPKSNPLVLGAETSKQSKGVMETILFFVGMVVLYSLSILKYLFVNAGIFYPVLALLFFYILWRIYKRMRRPAWQK